MSGQHSPSFRGSTSSVGTIFVVLVSLAVLWPVHVQADLSSFDIGLITDQTARHGYTRSFEVYSSELGSPAAFTMDLSPEPAGLISLEPLVGGESRALFSYTPDVQDRKPFEITFTASSAVSSVSQTVIMTAVADLVPESDIITYVRPLPDPTSQTTVVEEDITTGEVHLNHIVYPFEFEGELHFAKRVTVSGKTVLFDANLGSLHTSYHDRDDIVEMNISAETVIVRDPLHLPQTNVTINARELRFEDRDGADDEEKARIITTPRWDPTQSSAGQLGADVYNSADDVPAGNGSPGLNAGEVTVNVESLYVSDGDEATPAIRFVLSGGKGQNSGPGCPGWPGIPMASASYYPVTPPASQVPDPSHIVWYHFEEWRAGNCDGDYDGWHPDEDWTYGIATWPGNGGNAVAPGTPGPGGEGAGFSSTLDPGVLDLSTIVDVAGGAPGDPGLPDPSDDVVQGGAAGTPNPAYWASGHCWSRLVIPFGYVRCSATIVFTVHSHTSLAGADGIGPTNGEGAAGTFDQTAGSPLAWLTPPAARSVLMDARDTYLNGHIEQARAILEQYLDLLNDVEGTTPEDAVDFEQIRQEMETLYHRASNNLDYFGNPGGWVPMLSFEANMAAFENEIERAIRVLYATYWLDSKADEVLDKANAMAFARGQLDEELDEFIEAYYAAQEAIPGLQVQAANIVNQIEVTTQQLRSIEERLLEKAQDNLEPPWWEKALRVVGAGLKMIPVYQPALGAIGGGMNIIASVDSETSLDDLDSIIQEGEFAYTFRQADFVRKSDQMKRKLNEFKQEGRNDRDAYHMYVDSLHLYSKQIADGLGPLVQSIKGSQAPKSELEAEFEKLKAADPAFQQLSGEIYQLADQKELLAQRIADTMQTLTTMATNINQTMLGAIALDDNISENAQRIDDRAFMYIKEMERRAKDRLLKYQYHVMKAFEYRMLQEYSGELNLNRLFDAFRTLVDPAGHDHLLTPEEFEQLKAVYIEELSRITAQMFDALNIHAPERSVPITFALSQEEIDALNRDGFVYINMKDKNVFGRTEENLRIVDLRTKSLMVYPATGGGYGGTALLRLKYEHSGVSLVSSKGATYTFNHYRTASVNPITWKTVYNGIWDTIEETTVSAASESLLEFLLEDELGHLSPDLMLYSRPSAWADLLITKEQVTATGEEMVISDLQIEVQYDYFEKRTDQSELEVQVVGDLRPTILVESPEMDINGRRDGRGDFVRTFNRGETITLEAPATYGTWVFERWADASGEVFKMLEASPTVTIPMDAHKMIQAIYIDTADTDPPASPVITTNGGVDLTIGLPELTLAGTVDADTAIIELNGEEIDHEMGELNWQVNLSLVLGAQVFEVVALDDSLNPSDPASIVVSYIPVYDSDGDGIIDADEGTDDPDEDGIPNYLDDDSDNDGLSDGDESTLGTDPFDADSDGDGMPDGYEIDHGLDPTVDDGDDDDDDDGLTNIEEWEEGTDPQNPDTDGDGLPDGLEIELGLDPTRDEGAHDLDDDGLSNAEEFAAGTDPLNPDTDGDGLTDGFEVAHGSDPLDEESVPVLGDVNGDGYANAVDVQLAVNASMGNVGLHTSPDINYDGEIDALDVQLAINAAMGYDITPHINQRAGVSMTFYIDASHRGPEDGSRTHPYNTLGEAVAMCLAGRGDTIVVQPGIYAERITLKSAMTIIGDEGPAETLVTGLGLDLPVLVLADDTVVRGFAVGDAGTAAAIEVPEGAECEVTNCVLFSSGTALYASAGASVVFLNNTLVFNEFGVVGATMASIQGVNNIFAHNGVGISVHLWPESTGTYNDFYGNDIDLEGAAAAVTDMTEDPLFLDVLSLNLRLAPGSPLRDAGNPAPEYNDPDGSRNDLGMEGGPHGIAADTN